MTLPDKETPETPLREFPEWSFDGFEVNSAANLSLEIFNENGDSRVKVSGDNGDIFYIPAKYLAALTEHSLAIQLRSEREINEFRQEKAHPVILAKLKEATPSGVNPQKFVLKEEKGSLTRDGIPYLTWLPENRKENTPPGWHLGIFGTESLISSANWDNISGIEKLIDSMKSPENLLVMAGIANPAATAILAARMTAYSLRGDKTRPIITNTKIRKILEDNDIPDANNSERIMTKTLAIKSGNMSLRVAAAIVPSMVKPSREMTEEETILCRTDQTFRYNLRAKLVRESANQFFVKVNEAFLKAGWQVVELPRPNCTQLGIRDKEFKEQDAIWVTPFNSTQWAQVEEAAKMAAPLLDIYNWTS